MAPIIASTSPANNKTETGSSTSSPEKCVKVYQSGNVVRLDVRKPFFLRNEVFSSFTQPSYTWRINSSSGTNYDNEDGDPNGSMVLLVKKPPKGIPKSDYSSPTKGKPDYSIGGCPLECPFDLNEDFEEALAIDSLPLVFDGILVPQKYAPLELDDGRWAIRQISNQENDADNKKFAQALNLQYDTDGWKGNDPPVLAFVDCSSQNGALTLTGFRKKFKAFHVHMMGLHKPEAEMLKMKSFRKFHEENLLAEIRQMTTMAHAIYEKLHGEFPSKGNVFLEFVYKDPVSMFDLPPEDCFSKIAIRPLPGDANPSMKSLWQEIEDLEKWISILEECRDTDVTATSFLNSTCGTGNFNELNDSKASVNNKAVQDLLAQEPAIDLHQASTTEFSDSLDSVLLRTVQHQRADCDFTDRLWAVVRNCENAEDLQDCLQLVFQAVANKMYRPYLLLTNTTTMSKNLKLAMKGEVAGLLQMRTHSAMIKLVIECGLVKLFKDYSFALAMSSLVERGEVDGFAPNISDIPTSLSYLKKLHCVLEVMCLSKERLSLSVNVQGDHVKKMLKKFSDKNHSIHWDHTYHFDVTPNDVRRVMTGLHPIYYKVQMESQTFLKWARTTVVASPEKYICYKKSAVDDFSMRQYYLYVTCECGVLRDR